MSRHALVLGGTGVIGSAVVRALADRGVPTTFTWFRNEARARELGRGGVRVDLRKPAEIRSLLAEGTPDVLIHCAAVHPRAPLSELSVEDFDAAVALSGRAAFVAVQELARNLIAQGRPGHVVFVGALERSQSLPLSAPFAAAQGMFGPLAMSFAKELGPHGILVNLVAGGLVGSGVSRDLDAGQLRAYEKLSALRRLGRPEEIAAPVVFLALDNRYMTGKVLAANGGIAERMAEVEVHAVTKRFDEVVALDQVSFTLSGPKLVVVLGPNGAGKTTLLDLVEGLAEPTSGRIALFGKDVGLEDYPRRRVGVVMQREFVLDGVTASDYADLFAAIYGVAGGRERILTRAELTARAKISVERLSGGEAQRLFIAAASVHDPEVLFLDEPTSELDPESKRRLGEHLPRFAEKALVVMTTHDLEEADRLADEVVFLFDGKLRAHGSKADVLGEHATLREAFFHHCGGTLSRSGEVL